MLTEICFNNIHRGKELTIETSECFTNTYIRAIFHQWCMNLKKWSGNMSREELKSQMNYTSKLYQLKHSCNDFDAFATAKDFSNAMSLFNSGLHFCVHRIPIKYICCVETTTGYLI